MNTFENKNRTRRFKLLVNLSRKIIFTFFIVFNMPKAEAFSLLGPFEEWQTPDLGYNVDAEEIGAAKELGEEYRWNVPVITYGVDRSFIDFFGPAGVQAIQEAFYRLNLLPASDNLDLNSMPIDVRRKNPLAESKGLKDLRSAVLSLVLEQLGLAAPEQWLWSLRARSVNSNVTNYLVINRNYDPATLEESAFVHTNRYTYQILEFAADFYADPVEIPINVEHAYSSVAGWARDVAFYGHFSEYLTRDDAGGLAYLLSPGNINFETLPSGVQLADPNSGEVLVRDALRPGVNKIMFEFIDEPWDSIPGWSYKLEWDDAFYLGNQLKKQRVSRIQTRPDFVFSAGDLNKPAFGFRGGFLCSRPNWKKVGASDLAGPGIIEGPVTITLGTLDPLVTEESLLYWELPPRWGSFGGNLDVLAYPVRQPATPQFSFQKVGNLILLPLSKGRGYTFAVERSSDLKTWTPTGDYLSFTNQYYTQTTNFPGNTFYRAVSLPLKYLGTSE